MSKREEIIQRSRAAIPGGVNSPARAFHGLSEHQLVAREGRGAILVDVDGREYIDFVLSWGPLILGHCDPEVVDAVCKQARKGTSFGVHTEEELELAEFILNTFDSMDMIRFVNSGTEATMSAIRLARGFTGRNKVIKFEGNYHGHVDSLLVSAGSAVIECGEGMSLGLTEGIISDTFVANYNDPSSVEMIYDRYGSEIACVICEPVVGNSGLIPPKDGFLQFLREITAKYGSLLILDEIITGFRVHPVGAQSLYGIKPDLTLLGKAIGGGLNVAAYGGRREIMEKVAPLGRVYQAGTLSGNPLAMVAGLTTVQKWLKDPSLFETAQAAARGMSECIREGFTRKGIPVCTYSVGALFGYFIGVEDVRDFKSASQSDNDLFKRFFVNCLKEGVYLPQSRFEACFTSSAHDSAVIDRARSIVERAINKL